MQQAAQQHNIPFRAIHITDKEAAQNVSAPVTTYALFRDGVFLTQGIQSDKKFLALADVQIWKNESLMSKSDWFPTIKNDAVSFCRYQDADVCKQVDNRDTPHDLALLHRI